MLRRTRRQLYLSPSRIALAVRSRRYGLAFLKRSDLTGPDAISAIREVLANWGQPKAKLRIEDIIFDDRWCRYFMVTPPTNASAIRDITFAAANRFEALYDETPADWAIEGDWKATRPFLACAMYRPLLTALQQTSVSGVAHVVPATMHYSRRLGRKHRTGHRWLIAAGAEQSVVLVFENGAVADVHQLTITPGLWSEKYALPDLLDQECLRLNRTMPSDVVLCGDVPSDWQPSPLPAVRVHVDRDRLPL